MYTTVKGSLIEGGLIEVVPKTGGSKESTLSSQEKRKKTSTVPRTSRSKNRLRKIN